MTSGTVVTPVDRRTLFRASHTLSLCKKDLARRAATIAVQCFVWSRLQLTSEQPLESLGHEQCTCHDDFPEAMDYSELQEHERSSQLSPVRDREPSHCAHRNAQS